VSVPVGPDTPSPPRSGVEAGRDRSPDGSSVHPGAKETLAGICPYLVSEAGAWRTAVPSREHRCSAVEPAAPQTTEKQRRHCLSPDHTECTLFRAARAARATSLARGPDLTFIDRADARRRAVARTAPVVLEPPRLVDQVTRLQFDRTSGQVALIGLMLVAFAVVAIARFSAGGSTGSSPGPSAVAVASASPRPTPSRTPGASADASSVPSVAPSAGPSFRTTYTVKKGDTLVGIANKYKTTAAKIRTLNGLKSNTLKAGQVLKIP
jgi:LysM repeat protein